MQQLARPRRKKPITARNRSKTPAVEITPAGLAYMKCVTSPNDFEIDQFQGIPDEYDGRTISKRHTSLNTLPTPTAATDFYIVLMPTPGVAFWYGTRTINTTASLTLTPVLYSDSATIFPTAHESEIVNGFRYASNVVEIVPTVNSMSWGGAIEVWKANLLGGLGTVGATGTATYNIAGFETLNSLKPQSVLPFNHGCYSVTTCCNAENMFTPILSNSPSADIVCPLSTGTAVTLGGGGNFTGMGCQESVIIRLPYSTASNTAMVRTWACVEYTLSTTSILYDYSHMSPSCDRAALALVRQFIHENPTAIPYYDNDSFWKNFLGWVHRVSGVIKIVPGITGEIAGVANLVSKIALDYA